MREFWGYEKSGLVLAVGGGIYKDIAGNNTITNNNSTLTTDHNGRANRGFLIDASGEYIDCGDVAIPGLYGANGKMTVCVGFTYKAEARLRYLLGKINSTHAEFILSFQSDNNLQCYCCQDRTFTKLIATTLTADNFTDGNKYFVTFVYNNSLSAGSKIKGYVDSVYKAGEIMSGTFTEVSNTTASLIIGNSYLITNHYYNGMIDLVLIYDRALSASQISKNYNYWRSH